MAWDCVVRAFDCVLRCWQWWQAFGAYRANQERACEGWVIARTGEGIGDTSPYFFFKGLEVFANTCWTGLAWAMLARESIVARSLWRARYARLPPRPHHPHRSIVVYIPPLKNWTYFQLMLSCPYGGDFNQEESNGGIAWDVLGQAKSRYEFDCGVWGLWD